MSSPRVAVIGLGLMGSRMAANLMAHGFEVYGYDIDQDRLEEFIARGGRAARSPAEAVQDVPTVVLSLPTSAVTAEVCFGKDGISSAGREGLFVYDTTTGAPEDAIITAGSLGGLGVTYSDATVSGNGEIAERGELVVLMGGTTEAFSLGVPLFEAIGRSHHHVGPVGSGSRMKLIVNHVLAIHRLALAEALVVAELAGIDLASTVSVLKDSLAYSRAMDAWGERMIAGDHEVPFSRLRQSHKDARLIVEHGEGLGASMDLMNVVRSVLEEGEAGGLSDFDNSSVAEVMRRRAGVGRIT